MLQHYIYVTFSHCKLSELLSRSKQFRAMFFNSFLYIVCFRGNFRISVFEGLLELMRLLALKKNHVKHAFNIPSSSLLFFFHV